MWDMYGAQSPYGAAMPGQPDPYYYAAQPNEYNTYHAPIQQQPVARGAEYTDINQIRNLPEIQEIAQYLRGMKLKKKLFGGCDEESVLNYILEVTKKYEAILVGLFAQLEQKDQEIALLRYELSIRPNESHTNYAAICAFWQEQCERQVDLMQRNLEHMVRTLEVLRDDL